MTDDNKKENSLSNEIKQRGDLDPLKWWSQLNDSLKIRFYINLKFKTELDIRKGDEALYNFFREKFKSLKAEKDSIRKLDKETIKSILNLTKLYLYGNKISDISSLSNLINLTELNLCINEISDISSLSNLTNLTKLDLGYNPISDISSLSNLTNLTKLDLLGNKISDISAIWVTFLKNQNFKIYSKIKFLNLSLKV